MPEQLDDPIFREVFDYWSAKCDGEHLPSRKDIDPTDIWKVLGNIVLIEVVTGAPRPRFRYRLWGTRVTELYGKDYTGYMLDQVIIPASREKIQAVFEWVIENRTPHFWQVPVPAENRNFVSNRRLLLPLATDGRTIDMLMAVILGDRRA
ncbi:PAS domain-containing protein [Hwanghaeella sp.]|uniref:PAS domain-containing protein n=1 Tax=Hwanghaeella sp. TaxID=2605943 RepID=UPI003CCBF9E9